ncbi:MAG: stage III sporulation protein AA [Candidatus Choladocola sp.]|nr:stage III sporulation protein AA [Candidatus Choladocola sp.]
MDNFYRLFAVKLRKILESSCMNPEKLQEIRMRANNPLLLLYDGKEYTLTEHGELTEDTGEGCIVSKEELNETLEYISGYSLYAFDEEMKQGYITVPGGHRIGLAGKIVMDGKKIQCIRHISFINIRLSHQILGCADEVMPYIVRNQEICHVLVISPPRCGKTTLLRDMIRQISNGSAFAPGKTVGVVDERSEIGGSYLGIPQNDLGIRTDLLDCCTKSEGMMMLLRSMSPQVIAVDELGNSEDGDAVESVFHCGCKLIATVHGNSVDDIKKKPLLHKLVREHMFERYIVLWGREKVGKVKEIFDSRGSLLYRNL